MRVSGRCLPMDELKVEQETILEVAEDIARLAPIVEPPDFTKRKNPAPFSLQQLSKTYTEEALSTLVEIMRNPEELGSTRIEAAKHILDRGWGKSAIKADIKTTHVNVHEVLKELSNQIKEPPKLAEVIDVTPKEIADDA